MEGGANVILLQLFSIHFLLHKGVPITAIYMQLFIYMNEINILQMEIYTQVRQRIRTEYDLNVISLFPQGDKGAAASDGRNGGIGNQVNISLLNDFSTLSSRTECYILLLAKPLTPKAEMNFYRSCLLAIAIALLNQISPILILHPYFKGETLQAFGHVR